VHAKEADLLWTSSQVDIIIIIIIIIIKDQGLGHLARSISRITAALASISSVFQLFSSLVDCSGMILNGFGVVAFFAGVRASSFCIHLSCLVCIQSVVCGIWSRLSYSH
jgi:hypothetical protein